VHPVTKILVVFAAILSVLLSALTIAYTANAQRIKEQYLDAQRAREAALAAKAAQDAIHSEERARLEAEIASIEQTVNELEQQKTSLQQDNAQLLARVKRAESESQAIQGRLDELAATTRTQSTLISSYRDELSTLRQSELQGKQREIQLTDRISNLTAQLEVAMQTNRALREQIAELRQQFETEVASVETQRSLSATRPVRATVTELSQGPAGDLLAQINAGSNDRLRAQMELTIVQDGQFAGKLVLTSVELNEAVGRVDTLNLGTNIRPGATVYSAVRP